MAVEIHVLRISLSLLFTLSLSLCLLVYKYCAWKKGAITEKRSVLVGREP